MARLVFRDFDEFADAISGVAGRFIPTARSTAEWWIESTKVHHISLQQLQIGSPATFAGDGEPDSTTIGLPMTDPTRLRIDGHLLEQEGFVLLHQDQPFTFTCQEVARWATVSVPLDSALVAPDLLQSMRSPGSGPRARSALPYLDRLRWVTDRILSSSIDFDEPAAVEAAEAELSLCLTHVLERSMKVQDRHVGRPQFSRARVIARTLALIEANEGQPLFVDDLCRATQVCERTLRNIFHEFFGVGPMRLLKVRQLWEIRAALLRADPQRDTVTRIAARFAIWDFALFARNYKALFGESPSRTLRTPPSHELGRRSKLCWLQYATRIFDDDRPGERSSPSPSPSSAADEMPPVPVAQANVSVRRAIN